MIILHMTASEMTLQVQNAVPGNDFYSDGWDQRIIIFTKQG